MDTEELFDTLDSFIAGFGNRDNPDVNNAVFIANELFNMELPLEWRGAGRQGILSLRLYGMIEEVEPQKKNPETFNAGRKLSRYNSRELMLMASYLWNEGRSALSEKEMEEARALLEEWEKTEERGAKPSEAVTSG